jgi:hypothetical protein
MDDTATLKWTEWLDVLDAYGLARLDQGSSTNPSGLSVLERLRFLA